MATKTGGPPLGYVHKRIFNVGDDGPARRREQPRFFYVMPDY